MKRIELSGELSDFRDKHDSKKSRGDIGLKREKIFWVW